MRKLSLHVLSRAGSAFDPMPSRAAKTVAYEKRTADTCENQGVCTQKLKGPPAHISASVVIPAHNEEARIARILSALSAGTATGHIEVIVVCNGCTDRTSLIARRHTTGVRVFETANASKMDALRLGVDCALGDSVIFVDADVYLSWRSLNQLLCAMDTEGKLAAAPTRVIELSHSSCFVRSFYRVWEVLPQVQGGLFGRGVIALSGTGVERFRALPTVLSDDLVLSEAFEFNERVIVRDSTVRISAPRTARDLVRRRMRVTKGTFQARSVSPQHSLPPTTLRTLAAICVAQPRLATHAIVFLAIGAISKLLTFRAIRRNDFTGWERDESSRTGFHRSADPIPGRDNG